MTAKTDLLPLHYDELPEIPEDIVVRMQFYARANVAHAIAPLQAEIEALRAVVEQRDKLRSALAGVIGASTKEELDEMEIAVRSIPGNEEDRAVVMNAIHALRDCAV